MMKSIESLMYKCQVVLLLYDEETIITMNLWNVMEQLGDDVIVDFL